jgi:aminopeptidase
LNVEEREMTSDFETKLRKYAEVIVRSGLNLQPGQRLLIGIPLYGLMGVSIETAPLVREIAATAYQAGARFVDVMWNDEQLLATRFKEGDPDNLVEFPSWRGEAAVKGAEEGDAILILYSENPELLSDFDPKLAIKYRTAFLEATKPFVELRYKLATNITIAAAPVRGWTKKVFPDLSSEEGEDRFWEAIFQVCRVNEKNPVEAWKEHFADLEGRLRYLNKKKYRELHFIGPGTDLTIGLPQAHNWNSALMTSQRGISFSANIPTEEVFTIPHKDQTEGSVAITKPIVRAGGIIEDAVLRFSAGKVVEAKAKTGLESLEKVLATDSGHSRLGEVALVPHSSPISQSGLTFFNILFDENASSHIALGDALKVGLEGGTAMSDEAFSAAGGNLSLGHLDIMIGSGEIDLNGIMDDDTSEPLMRSGEWAFEV